MKPVHFVDTTLRDGNASLWAGGMRTGTILPVAGRIGGASRLLEPPRHLGFKGDL